MLVLPAAFRLLVLRRLNVQAARNAGGVTYSLTDKGLDLTPMLIEMIVWSAKHDAATAADPDFVAAALRDRDALAATVMDEDSRPHKA